MARRAATRAAAGKKGFGSMLKRKQQSASDISQPRAPIRKGNVGSARSVPGQIDRPPYAFSGDPGPMPSRWEVHDPPEADRMRASGRLAATVLENLGGSVDHGSCTDDIDASVHGTIIANNAYPSPLNYAHFPKSVCTSVNEVVCHGIPDDSELCNGDLVNVDVTNYLEGYHGDTSRMLAVGGWNALSTVSQELVAVTKEALERAIAACGPGVQFKRIAEEIEDVAKANSMRVVRDYTGHGVGQVFHAQPVVLHHRELGKGNEKMRIGQTFTVEPILSLGSSKSSTWPDRWTCVTNDHSWTAQWEHTILITENGAEVLTRRQSELKAANMNDCG